MNLLATCRADASFVCTSTDEASVLPVVWFRAVVLFDSVAVETLALAHASG